MRSAAVIVAVLSRAYLGSGRGTAERQVALRTDPARLVTVRVEDGPLAGVPPTLPAVDLREPDRRPRRDRRAAGPAGRGRRRPRRTPRTARRRPVGSAACGATARRRGPPRARSPLPPFPPAATPDHRRRRAAARRGPPVRARARRSRRADHRARPAGPDPGRGHPADRRGRPRARPAGGERRRHRVGTAATARTRRGRSSSGCGSRSASTRGGWSSCRARGTCPVRRARPTSTRARPANGRRSNPYFPKLELWAELFADLYDGLDGPVFDDAQPWTLFAVPELRVAVAGPRTRRWP